jgi:hypothetical protein
MFQTDDASETLDGTGATANAAIDMFLDPIAKNASQAKMADYEVMIWFATYGYSQPFGNDTTLQHIVPVQPERNSTL